MALPTLLKDLADSCKSKAIVSGLCSYERRGPVHVVLAHDSIAMGILHIDRGSGIPFLKIKNPLLTSEIERINPVVAICGAFYSTAISNGPSITGEIVKNGKYLDSGDPGINYAYMVYTSSGVYGFGKGSGTSLGMAPKTCFDSIVRQGIGGLIPIIIGGSPTTGNSWYNNGNKKTGRCIVGHNPELNYLFIIAQEWEKPQFNLDHFSDFSADLGCTNVVGLDGSDSAMLWYNSEWKFRPGRVKDRWNKSAVFFGYASYL